MHSSNQVLINVEPYPIDRILFLDFEWSLRKDQFGEFPMLAASFVDSEGASTVLLREDFLVDGNYKAAEYKILCKIIDKIAEYDYSIGFYSTGIRAYNPRTKKMAGRDSDLIQLHRRLERFGMISPVRQSEYTKVPYIAGYDNSVSGLPHLHIDAYQLFINQVIKNSIYKGAYSANDLDTIGKAIVGRGKYNGMKGVDFESLTDLDEKRKYALADSQLLKDCITANNYELLHVLNSISNLTGVSFRDVCKSKGVSKLWTPVLDELIRIKISDVKNGNVAFDQKLVDTWINYYHRPTYKQQEEPIILEDPDDLDDEEANNKDETRYIGGLVLTPKPAAYKDVLVFDVASLYPTMIIEYNLSFDSVNCGHDECNTNKVPSQLFSFDSNDQEVDEYTSLSRNDPVPILSSIKTKRQKDKNWHICLKHIGLFAEQTNYYRAKRLEFKELAKDKSGLCSKDQLREFEMNAASFKILMNGGYGYSGFRYAKYENVAMAELVTRYGRYTLRQIVNIAASEFGLQVIYGDTDSVFTICSTLDETSIAQFLDRCQTQLNVKLEVDKQYDRLVLCGKKNYLGVTTTTNKLKVVGLSGKKSNRCPWVRNNFNQMLEDYRDGIDPLINLRKELEKLETGKLKDIETNLLMRINLNMNPDEYKNKCPQKQIGLEKDLESGETANFYLSDFNNRGKNYTFDPNQYSVTKYKDQLIRATGQFLKVLGIDPITQLMTPSESLLDQHETKLKENTLMSEDNREDVANAVKMTKKGSNNNNKVKPLIQI